jgi:NAD(P)-dependent dehydrogenase (short-subunit alcohol dehydrogenase family)
MMKLFQDKVAIVTGGASGIGRALCEALARAGARVVVADLNFAGAQRVAEALDAQAAAVDIADAEAVERLVQQTAAQQGRLDYMFNIAGICVVGELRDLSVDQWRRMVHVNVLGVIHGATAAYRVMLRQRSGHIVNMASLAGLTNYPIFPAYSATKAAVAMFSDSLRVEAAALGIHVTTVCPAFIQSGIWDNSQYVNVSQAAARAIVPFPEITAAEAAGRILRGVARNEARIVFPAYAHLLLWFAQWLPPVSRFLQTDTLKKLRRARQPAT